MAGNSVYGGTKAFLIMLTESLHLELKLSGTRVQVIAPRVRIQGPPLGEHVRAAAAAPPRLLYRGPSRQASQQLLFKPHLSRLVVVVEDGPFLRSLGFFQALAVGVDDLPLPQFSQLAEVKGEERRIRDIALAELLVFLVPEDDVAPRPAGGVEPEVVSPTDPRGEVVVFLRVPPDEDRFSRARCKP